MNVKVEKVANNTMQMEIELDDAQLQEGLDKAYKKLVKKVNIPGFRKGKAPRKILEGYIGKAALLEEALDYAVPIAYFQAVKDNTIEPVEQPKIEIVQFEEDKPIIFKATVDIKPEVKLGEYKGLEITPRPINVTEEDIEKYLENLQKRNAKLITVEEGEVQNGDMITMDFKGFVNDEQFPGGTAEDYSLEIGSGQFIPGFEEQMTGMKIGEERDINVTFPDEYHAEDLKGKPATFKVVVKSIKRKEYASVDDEFAKDVSEFATLDELKDDIKKRLEETEHKAAEENLRNQAIDKALEKVEVEVPSAMIEQRIDTLVDNFGYRLQQQGLELDKYLQYTNATIKDIREQYRPEAEKAVKVDLMLENIAKAENLEVKEEDINAEIERISKYYNQSADSIRDAFEKNNTMPDLKQGLLINKAIDFLVDNCTKTA